MKHPTKVLMTEFQLQTLPEYRYPELIQTLMYELAEHDKEVRNLIKGKSVRTKENNQKLTEFGLKDPVIPIKEYPRHPHRNKSYDYYGCCKKCDRYNCYDGQTPQGICPCECHKE